MFVSTLNARGDSYADGQNEGHYRERNRQSQLSKVLALALLRVLKVQERALFYAFVVLVEVGAFNASDTLGGQAFARLTWRLANITLFAGSRHRDRWTLLKARQLLLEEVNIGVLRIASVTGGANIGRRAGVAR